MLPDTIALAQAICTRLCHDLGGPAGALSGALDLLDGPGDDALDVARDAARIMDRRIRFYRAAVGAGCGDCRLDEMAQLAEGLTLGRRAQVDLTDLEPNVVLPAHVAQALLLAMWVAVDALPRGGTVRVGGDMEGGFSVWPDGQAAAWPASLAAGIGGEAIIPHARSVAVPMLLALGGIRVAMLLGGSAGAAPLLITAETRN